MLYLTRWRMIVPLLFMLIVGVILAPAQPVAATGASTLYVPIALKPCTNDDQFQPSGISRYMHLCQVPAVHWVVTWPNDPTVKVEWLLPQKPDTVGDTLWWSEVEPYDVLEYTPTNAAKVVDIADKIAKARAEVALGQLMSKESLDDLTAIANEIKDGAIQIQQVELAVGLAFAGPPGWIIAGFVVAVAAGVIIYAVLQNQNQHTGVGWTQLNKFSDHQDSIFTIDRLEEDIPEGAQNTGGIDDHFFEGTPGRISQRMRILEEVNNEGPQFECQNWDGSQDGWGATAVWWKNNSQRFNVFIHSRKDPSRDTVMRRRNIRDMNSSNGQPYYDIPLEDPRCQEAVQWLMLRVRCYVLSDQSACADLGGGGLLNVRAPARKALRSERRGMAIAM